MTVGETGGLRFGEDKPSRAHCQLATRLGRHRMMDHAMARNLVVVWSLLLWGAGNTRKEQLDF